MSQLKTTLEALAAEFAGNVLAAIKSASLEEIMHGAASGHAPSRARAGGRRRAASRASAVESKSAVAPRAAKTKGGRLARRSPEALANVRAQIVALLAKNPKGLRSEQIRAKLGITKQEIPRPLQDALVAKQITKKGEKRATTYFKK